MCRRREGDRRILYASLRFEDMLQDWSFTAWHRCVVAMNRNRTTPVCVSKTVTDFAPLWIAAVITYAA